MSCLGQDYEKGWKLALPVSPELLAFLFRVERSVRNK